MYETQREDTKSIERRGEYYGTRVPSFHRHRHRRIHHRVEENQRVVSPFNNQACRSFTNTERGRRPAFLAR